jgi:predicted outer membrane protein
MVALAVVAALGIAGACTPDEEGAIASSETAAGVSAVPPEALTNLAVKLTDENVIALLDTTYDAMIELGGLAVSKARDTRVRETASEALTRHRTLRSENLSLASLIKASPKLADMSPVEGHHDALEQLRMRAGAQFDRTYLDHSITMHDELLSEVREALDMPMTVQVRDHLERVAATLETDLTRARELKSVLEAGAA